MIIKEVHFTPQGGETSLDPKVSGHLEVIADQEWIKTRVENGKIILTVPSFVSGIKRTGTIDIRTKTDNKKVNIVQKAGILEINGTKSFSASISEKNEYKLSLRNSFEENQSRIALRLKDEKDASWLKAEFSSNTEIKVTKDIDPARKPKTAIIYLVVDGDIESTVMDSISVDVTYKQNDLIDTKWIASFTNRNSVAFKKEVKMIKGEYGSSMYLTGLSASEDSEIPIKIPFSYSDWNKKFNFTLGNGYNDPLAKDNNENEIHLLGVTKEFTTWDITDDNAPSTYSVVISVDGDKVVMNFSDFVYTPWAQGSSSYPMSGFMLKSYKNLGMNEYWETTYEPVETLRWLLDFKLTLITE